MLYCFHYIFFYSGD